MHVLVDIFLYSSLCSLYVYGDTIKCDWDYILHTVLYPAFLVQYILNLFPWQCKHISQLPYVVVCLMDGSQLIQSVFSWWTFKWKFLFVLR